MWPPFVTYGLELIFTLQKLPYAAILRPNEDAFSRYNKETAILRPNEEDVSSRYHKELATSLLNEEAWIFTHKTGLQTGRS